VAGGAPVVGVLLLGELVVVVAVLGCGAVAVVAPLLVEPVVVAGALALVLALEPFDELPQAASPSAPTSRSAAITAEMRLVGV
jgi:purine-cytosine permease-like protein